MDRPLTQVGWTLELNGLGMVTREVVEAAREVLAIGTTERPTHRSRSKRPRIVLEYSLTGPN
jgi:hypothetical protein